MKEMIRNLYDYNAWANRLVADSLEPLSTEAFTAEMGGSFRSIRDTLLHILGAERIWSGRIIGAEPRTLLAPADFPDLGSFRRVWPDVDAEYFGFLDGGDVDFDRQITYTNRHGNQYTYSVGEMLLNNVNHSSYHRGQIITLQRQIGAKPAVTDYLVWIDQNRG